jgi:hypothetical protein
MSPKSRGRPKGRGRTPARRRPPDRQLTDLDHLLHEATGLRDCSLLEAQAVASAWLGSAWQKRTLGQQDAEGDLVRAVVGATRGPRADAAYLALHALATIPDEHWRDDVAAALEGAPSDAAPTWAVDPRTRAPEAPYRAHRWSDPWGSNLIHLVRFTEPIEHSLIVNETTVGGRYVHVIEVGVQGAEPDAVIGGLTVAEVDPGEALADIADALWQTDMYWPPQDDPAYTLTRALAHWRTRGHRRDVEWEPLPDDQRRQLIDDFAAEHAVGVDAGIVEVLADTFIDFGDGYLHGGVLAWSPDEVARFMLDWVHRKVLLDAESIDALPAVLTAWVRFALRRRGLAPEHITPVVHAVAQAQDEFHDLTTDGSAGGPAKEILTRLLAEGVDLHDREAVDRVIGAYNAEQNARSLLDP